MEVRFPQMITAEDVIANSVNFRPEARVVTQQTRF